MIKSGCTFLILLDDFPCISRKFVLFLGLNVSLIGYGLQKTPVYGHHLSYNLTLKSDFFSSKRWNALALAWRTSKSDKAQFMK
jgi:hypothetical protein